MKYIAIIEKVSKDILIDLGSLRVQLIIAAYIFNFAVLYLVGWKGVDYKLAGISISMLTAIYAFFFASKSQQAQMEHSTNYPTSSVDPDEVKDDAN